MWRKPLRDFIGLSLAEIRSLPGYGEKRVHVVIETIGMIHRLLGERPRLDHLTLGISPKFVVGIEAWLRNALRNSKPPTHKEVRNAFVLPLLKQVRIDAGREIALLVKGRLGLNGKETPVRDSAQRRGLSRARIYQLLIDVGTMLDVRWPDGRRQVADFFERFHDDDGTSNGLCLMRSAALLFFPGTRRRKHRNSRPQSPFGILQAG